MYRHRTHAHEQSRPRPAAGRHSRVTLKTKNIKSDSSGSHKGIQNSLGRGRAVLFDPVEHEVGGDDEPLLVGRVGQVVRQARGLGAVLARQEARLLQPARLVHQLERLLHVARLLEPPHDHRVQLRVLKRNRYMISRKFYLLNTCKLPFFFIFSDDLSHKKEYRSWS